MKYTLLRYLLVPLSLCASCKGSPEGNGGGTPEVDPPVVEAKDVRVWTTTADKSQLFKESFLPFKDKASMSPRRIEFTSDTYQTADGFGAALTVSSCYNILKMSPSDRTRLLKEIFDPAEGLGSSLARVCIGGSDFSWDYSDPSGGRFTWCDKEGIDNFAPHPLDVKYVVPVLKEIYAIHPDLKLIGSPWTCPRWMKVEEKSDKAHYSWIGGRLDPSCYQDYATCFVKWIQYMEGQGFDIYAVTPQNEPLNAGNSMSLRMKWEDQRDFIKTALGPALRKAGLDTRILVFDHNYNYDNQEDQAGYPLNIYRDAEASRYIAGSAWHNYGGSVSELERIAREAPGKDIYFTEASIGTWNLGERLEKFGENLLNDFRDIFLGTLSRNGKGVTLWNLMLDDKKGPYTDAGGSCTTCYGAVTIASSDYKTVDRSPQYYEIAHASKVIRPGAVRIGTKGFSASGVTYQAWRNTDGSTGVVMLNESAAVQDFVFITGSHSVRGSVPAKSITSLLWKD